MIGEKRQTRINQIEITIWSQFKFLMAIYFTISLSGQKDTEASIQIFYRQVTVSFG